MGNCCVSMKESSMIWGGEDWGSPSPSPVLRETTETKFSSGIIGHSLNSKKVEEESLIGDQKKGTSVPSTITGTEVKIKITKKQLEEILTKVDVQGQSLKQVLTQLINLSDGDDDHEVHHQRHWKPALQTIPETDLY